MRLLEHRIQYLDDQQTHVLPTADAAWVGAELAREAESIARHIAVERARKLIDEELIEIEGQFKEKLGTRVRIEKKDEGGRVTIDFFNKDDLRALLERIAADENQATPQKLEEVPPLTEEEKILAEDDDSLYSVTKFSI